MHYYDVHSHFLPLGPGITAIVNRYWDGLVTGDSLYAAGLHPWYLEEGKMEAAKQWLTEQSISPDCVAIGEAGLDRVAGATWALQMAAFEICVKHAVELKKPLILHCVRAFEDVLTVKRHFGKPADNIPWIFHGFNKKTAIADRLLDAGTFLSFGAALLDSKFPAADALRICRPDRFFLETDDRKDISIQDIYVAAALIRNTTVAEISLQIENNFHSVFHK